MNETLQAIESLKQGKQQGGIRCADDPRSNYRAWDGSQLRVFFQVSHVSVCGNKRNDQPAAEVLKGLLDRLRSECPEIDAK